MQTHRVLAERLEALLGPPHSRGQSHAWHLRLDRHSVNIALDLPDALTKVRVWIFDPRAKGADCARHYTVKNPAELEHVVGEVAALALELEQQASASSTSVP